MDIVLKEKAKEIIENTLNIAYDSVAHTLGPGGSNTIAIIDGVTTVTNDGVSIIRELELEDEISNIPLKIIKEACFNAENKSGDGTTTSIVLTKHIYDLGLKYMNEHKINPIALRDKIFEEYNYYEKLIREQKRIIKGTKDIEGIASVSLGGNKELGKEIAIAFALVNFVGKIKYSINPNIEGIETKSIMGYNINSKYIGEMDMSNDLEFNDCRVLVYEGKIDSIEDLRNIAAFNREDNRRDLIVFSNFGKDALNATYYYNNSGGRIYAFDLPDFGIEREKTLNEIRFLSNAMYMDKDTNIQDFSVEDIKQAIGIFKKCIVSKNGILIKLNEEDTYNKFMEFLKNKNPKKVSEVEYGIAYINVGGKTKVEAEETLLRIEDAVNSVKLALETGIVIGGANLLYNLSTKKEHISTEILANAIKEPLYTISENAGYNKESLEYMMSKSKDIEKGFNVQTSSLENLFETGIIDPTETVVNSLKSAVSIATSLLTINCIINKKKNKNGGF